MRLVICDKIGSYFQMLVRLEFFEKFHYKNYLDSQLVSKLVKIRKANQNCFIITTLMTTVFEKLYLCKLKMMNANLKNDIRTTFIDILLKIFYFLEV